jgi:hypothetical protein
METIGLAINIGIRVSGRASYQGGAAASGAAGTLDGSATITAGIGALVKIGVQIHGIIQSINKVCHGSANKATISVENMHLGTSNGPTAREAAAMCEDVYNTANGEYKDDNTPDMGLNGWHLDKAIADELGMTLTDPKTDFNSAIYSRQVFNSQTNSLERQHCYVLAGTDFTSRKDWSDDGEEALGYVAEQYTQAIEQAKKLKNGGMLDGRDFTVAGHSLGGGMASLLSLYLNVHGITFNAAGLHRNTKTSNNIPLDKIANVDAYVINGEIVHTLQRLVGLSAEGNMTVLPFQYISQTQPEWHPVNVAIELTKDYYRGLNHTIGQMRKLMQMNGIR